MTIESVSTTAQESKSNESVQTQLDELIEETAQIRLLAKSLRTAELDEIERGTVGVMLEQIAGRIMAAHDRIEILSA